MVTCCGLLKTFLALKFTTFNEIHCVLHTSWGQVAGRLYRHDIIKLNSRLYRHDNSRSRYAPPVYLSLDAFVVGVINRGFST